jgi:hypothetical protein
LFKTYNRFSRSYDLSPDGQRFLMIARAEEAQRPRLLLVENWFEELRRLASVE